MRRNLLILVLSGACYAQAPAAPSAPVKVSIQFVPEPMEVLKAVGIASRLGLWRIGICNDSAIAVQIPPERIYMAAGSVRIVSPARASLVLSQRQKQSVKAVMVEVIEYALIGASVIGGGGMFSISTKGLGELALATGVAHTVHDKLQGQIPSLAAFTEDALTGPVALAPGQCATKSAFAAKMKNPQVVTTEISLSYVAGPLK
jgi:hypothetical protein